MGFHFLKEEPTLGTQAESSRGKNLKKNLNQIIKDGKRPESKFLVYPTLRPPKLYQIVLTRVGVFGQHAHLHIACRTSLPMFCFCFA